jgi:hypothetical protein
VVEKLRVETAIDVIGAWKQAGEPTNEEIQALFMTQKRRVILWLA